MAATDQAYDAIRQALVTGDYPAGAHLREEELAATIGVSRTPIREALRRLDAEGILKFVRNRGATVPEWSERDVGEIFELRALLESYSARLAAERIDDDVLARLGELADQMDELRISPRSKRFDAITELNNQFHRGILVAADNRRLIPLLAGVVQIPLVLQTFRRYTADDLQHSFQQHRDVLQALRNHDADWAEAAMRAHLYAGRNVFLRAPAGGRRPADRRPTTTRQ
ncbi:MAG: GntR family transcriptional regulator [Candidatus Dormibacter sp.]